MKGKEKKKEISSLLGALDDETFAMLSGLGRNITDYGTDKGAAMESEWHCSTCSRSYTKPVVDQRKVYILVRCSHLWGSIELFLGKEKVSLFQGCT